MKIHFFGIWAAINLDTDNTFFLIEDWEDNLQVDCSWWLWLARKVRSWKVLFSNLFISHKHPDHILGFFHLFRVCRENKITHINIYCSKNIQKTIIDVSASLWIRNISFVKDKCIQFHHLDDLKKTNLKFWTKTNKFTFYKNWTILIFTKIQTKKDIILLRWGGWSVA